MTKAHVFILIGLVTLVAYASYRWVYRERWSEFFNATLMDGGTIGVELERSHRLYWGTHVMGIGGGDHRVTLRFQYHGSTLEFKAEPNREPRILEFENGTPLVVVQGGLSVPELKRFYFYEYTSGGWHALSNAPAALEGAACNLSTLKPGDAAYTLLLEIQDTIRRTIRTAQKTKR